MIVKGNIRESNIILGFIQGDPRICAWVTCPHCGTINILDSPAKTPRSVCEHYAGVSVSDPGYIRFEQVETGENMDNHSAIGAKAFYYDTEVEDYLEKPESEEGSNIERGTDMQTENDNALALIQDDSLSCHVEAIKNRNTIIQRQLAALAKEMFTISMYTNQKEVIVDNCKMAVGMKPKDNQLRVSIFLKKPDKKSSQYTWQDIVAGMRDEQSLTPVIATLRGKPKKRRKIGDTGFTNSLPADKAIASYDVTTNWSVIWKDFDIHLGRLLPAARMLAQEQLKQLYEDTVSETAFMTSLDPIEEIPDEDIQQA